MAFTNTQGDGSGTNRWLHGNSDGELIDAWHPELQAEETANDSDKSITVTASEEWEILTIWVEFASTATAGARQLEIQIQDDAADVIMEFKAGLTQAASLTYFYLFGQAMGVEIVALRDGDLVFSPLPKIILPASYVVRVWDNNAVDAAADDMVIQMLVNKRSVP